MSLLTVRIFINAMEVSDDVTGLVGDRIYPVAVPGSDEDFEKTPLPYIVVGYSGPVNDPDIKDDIWEGETDKEQIHVLVVGEDIDQLAELEDKVRKAVCAYFGSLHPGEPDYGLLPDNGISVQGDTVQYNPWKPDYSHTLTYQCETKNTTYEQD
jgi:hypothetical protein